jgi:hypothetical protein
MRRTFLIIACTFSLAGCTGSSEDLFISSEVRSNASPSGREAKSSAPSDWQRYDIEFLDMSFLGPADLEIRQKLDDNFASLSSKQFGSNWIQFSRTTYGKYDSFESFISEYCPKVSPGWISGDALETLLLSESEGIRLIEYTCSLDRSFFFEASGKGVVLNNNGRYFIVSTRDEHSIDRALNELKRYFTYAEPSRMGMK